LLQYFQIFKTSVNVITQMVSFYFSVDDIRVKPEVTILSCRTIGAKAKSGSMAQLRLAWKTTCQTPWVLIHNQVQITLISRSITDAELLSPDVLESGTLLDHLVSPKKFPFRRKKTLLVSRIGSWENTSNVLTRR
jgi:hypothetical protein